jgi:hypothetical protein
MPAGRPRGCCRSGQVAARIGQEGREVLGPARVVDTSNGGRMADRCAMRHTHWTEPRLRLHRSVNQIKPPRQRHERLPVGDRLLRRHPPDEVVARLVTIGVLDGELRLARGNCATASSRCCPTTVYPSRTSPTSSATPAHRSLRRPTATSRVLCCSREQSRWTRSSASRGWI